jgi:hypothetical protein
MGNINSRSGKSQLLSKVEKITKLIHTMSWEDMQSLENPEKCNKIYVLATNILNKKLTNVEITYLTRHMKGTSNKTIVNDKTKQKLSIIAKSKLEIDPLKKKRMCQGIAIYYIQIAQIFGAIVKAINPQYIVNNDKKIPLSNYKEIDSRAKAKLKQFGFCEERIRALKPKKGEGDNIIVHPTPCEIIKNTNGELRVFGQLTGWRKMENLFKTEFNFTTGQWNKSEKDKKEYNRALNVFWRHFNGRKKPDHISQFSHIKLKDYSCGSIKKKNILSEESTPPTQFSNHVPIEPRFEDGANIPQQIEPSLTGPPQLTPPTASPEITPTVSLPDELPPISPTASLPDELPPISPTGSLPDELPPISPTASLPDELPPISPTGQPVVELPPPSITPFPTSPTHESFTSISPKISDISSNMRSYLGNSQRGGGKFEIDELKKKQILAMRRDVHIGSSDVFKNYANHLKYMIGFTKKTQRKLLDIINELFKSLDETFIINPELTEERLSELVVKTRNIIINMFLKCEQNFRRGLKLFDKIIIDKLTNQLKQQEIILKELFFDNKISL